MTVSSTPPAPGSRRERRASARRRARSVRLAVTGSAVGMAAAFGTVAAVAAAAAEAPGTLPVPRETIAPISAPLADVSYTERTVTEQVEIPPQAIEQFSGYVPQGERRVVSEGDPGISDVTFLVTEQNGVEVSREEILTVIVKESIDDVVEIGTLDVPTWGTVYAGTNRAIAQDMAASRYGWTGIQWHCLDNLWLRESGWRHWISNPTSGAHGIPQALPASKMASHGSDYMTNPTTQISWGLDYIKGRYGTPCYAWGFWNDRDPHWY